MYNVVLGDSVVAHVDGTQFILRIALLVVLVGGLMWLVRSRKF